MPFPADFPKGLLPETRAPSRPRPLGLRNRFPNEKDQIELAIKEAEVAAWGTPFPALFFPPLAHLKVRERIAQA